MSNQYPHQQEMDAITQRLLEYVEDYGGTATDAIVELNKGAKRALEISPGQMKYFEDWYVLNDLEEAVAVKNFCIKYQKKNREYFPNGRKRV